MLAGATYRQGRLAQAQATAELLRLILPQLPVSPLNFRGWGEAVVRYALGLSQEQRTYRVPRSETLAFLDERADEAFRLLTAVAEQAERSPEEVLQFEFAFLIGRESALYAFILTWRMMRGDQEGGLMDVIELVSNALLDEYPDDTAEAIAEVRHRIGALLTHGLHGAWRQNPARGEPRARQSGPVLGGPRDGHGLFEVRPTALMEEGQPGYHGFRGALIEAVDLRSAWDIAERQRDAWTYWMHRSYRTYDLTELLVIEQIGWSELRRSGVILEDMSDS
jgi:hypothetical protein